MKKIIKSKLQMKLVSTLVLVTHILFSSLFLTDEKIEPNKTEIKEEKVIQSFEDYAASNLPLISTISDKNIYLYGIKPTGVVLYVDGRGHYYDWSYLTPRFVLPKMHVGDFDNDGEEELAVVLYVGSGTGYAVEELHIVEISEDNVEYFKDHSFLSKDYVSQLNKLIKIKTHEKNKESVIVRIGDKLNTVSLKDYQSEGNDLIIENKPSFGNIVSFNVIDGKLVAKFALGIGIKSFATPIYIGEVHADVTYTEGNFKLSNPRFELNKGFSKNDK